MPDTEQSYSFIKSALFKSLTGNDGMQHLVDTAAKTVGNPIGIGIIDSSVMYMSPDMPRDRINSELEFLKDLNSQDFLEANGRKLDANTPIRLTYDFDKCECIYSELHLDGIMFGYFYIISSNRSFKHDDFKVTDIIKEVFELALKTDIGGAFLYKSDSGTKVLQNLFSGEKTFLSQNSLRQVLGLKNDAPLQVFVAAHTQHYTVGTPTFSTKERLSELLNSSLYITKDSYVIFLCNFNIKSFQKEISCFLNQNDLVAGVSYSFDRIEDMQDRYKQAMDAIRLGTLKNSGNIYFYDDYAIYRITEEQASQGKLQAFCHPSVWDIYLYDSKNNTNLLETLRVYLSCGRNLQSTSKHMNIHRNTVIQRLDKILELTKSYSYCVDSLYNIYLSILLIDFYSL